MEETERYQDALGLDRAEERRANTLRAGLIQQGEGVRIGAVVAEFDGRTSTGEPVEAGPSEIPERWGRLEILDHVGRGSFGNVFRAWDPKLDREVAVKLLHAERHPEAATVLREARLLARVRHPNVVTVYDADEFDGRVGLWMEFIHGKNLEEILREQVRLGKSEVTRIGVELCRALSAVHESGLLHRDIKTQNLMQTADGRLTLMDFGTGRELEYPSVSSTHAAGTPLYLAPELFHGAEATVRSDIYSAGVVLFRLLTGAFPVRETNHKEIFSEVRAGGGLMTFTERAAAASKGLSAVVGRAMRLDPSERFESARDMLAALEDLERRAGTRQGTRYWLALGTVSLVAAALAVAPGMRRGLQGRNGDVTEIHTTPERREVRLPPMGLPGTPSPDGQYLPYSEIDTSNLALYEFATGTSRTLTRGGDGFDKNFVAESIVSADSSRVAYSWNDQACQCVQLKVIDADGSNERVLTAAKDPAEIVPMQWSLDGGHILGKRSTASGETEILLVSTADGSIQPVRTLSFRPWMVSLSPDSRWIAYDRAEDPDDADRGIYLSSVDGGREIPVVTGPTYDSHAMWTPDGSALVFASLRTGGPGIWLQSLKDGEADAQPRLLDRDVGPFEPLTLTRKGSLFYLHRTSLMDVHTVPIDPVTGDLRGEPTIIANRFLGSNIAPDWSPDGNTLVFASWRTLFGPGQNILVFHSMDTGAEREVEVELRRVNGPRWSSDGRSVFVWGPDRKGINALRLVDVESGRILGTYSLKPGGLPPVAARTWGPDARHVYLKLGPEKISRVDLSTGQEEVLYRAPSDSVLGGPTVSPDGRWVAFGIFIRAEKRQRFLVIPAAGGPPRELFGVPSPEMVGIAGWTRDARQLLFVRTRTDETERQRIGELWAAPFEGAPPRSLGVRMPALRDVSVSPLGDRIAFTSGHPDKGTWVFENFLPRTAPRQVARASMATQNW